MDYKDYTYNSIKQWQKHERYDGLPVKKMAAVYKYPLFPI